MSKTNNVSASSSSSTMPNSHFAVLDTSMHDDDDGYPEEGEWEEGGEEWEEWEEEEEGD